MLTGNKQDEESVEGKSVCELLSASDESCCIIHNSVFVSENEKSFSDGVPRKKLGQNFKDGVALN